MRPSLLVHVSSAKPRETEAGHSGGEFVNAMRVEDVDNDVDDDDDDDLDDFDEDEDEDEEDDGDEEEETWQVLSLDFPN